MRPRDRRLAFLIALPGVIVCLGATAAFFSKIINNRLPWTDTGTAQEHYLAVGDSYSRGFTAGFFLCFFLAITAIAISSWVRHRRARRLSATTSDPRRRREDRADLSRVEAPRRESPVPAVSRR